MTKHTIEELQMLQALPLEVKVRKTEERIKEWVDEYGIDGVYVSFSGGKDSTVLLHIARRLFPTIKAVFVDTGLEYPEIREFVRSFDNVDCLKPKMNFKQVIEKYGYPFISKEVSECVDGARKYLRILTDRQTDKQTDRQTDRTCRMFTNTTNCLDLANIQKAEIIPNADAQSIADGTRGGTITSIANSEELANMMRQDKGKRKGSVRRFALLQGMLDTQNNVIAKANIPSGERSMFSQEKYKFFLEAPFEISSKCCSVMKKAPVHAYARQTGRKPMTAQMASESRLRSQQWLRNGCNGFDMKNPISNPMSFWTEQDVLYYIKINNVQIASVYGEIVKDYDGTDIVDGQMDMSELDASLGIFDIGRPTLKTTGCQRTGCMFCGYGCHLEKSPNRFERMKETHPKQYDYIMRPKEQGGLNYREVIDWINEHGNMNIKY